MRSLFIRWMALLLLCSTAACGAAATNQVFAWIDVPVDGLSLPDVQPLQITGHASALNGITSVEITVNDAPLAVIDEFSGAKGLAAFETSWTPPARGTYVLRVTAYDSTGSASAADSATITFGAAAPPAAEPGLTASETPTPTIEITPTLTITPTATATPTKTLPPAADIRFWAEPDTLDAGTCTSIKWAVTNALKVGFGGINQPLSGADEECPCATTTYTLTVIQLNGAEVQRTTTVNVSGSCSAPAPAAPQPMVPSNGLAIGCKSAQTLTWLPPGDSGDIVKYEVEVQKSPDNASWAANGGSPINSTDKTTSTSVECGFYYRWRVRAIGTGGSAGAWSGWWSFSVLLS